MYAKIFNFKSVLSILPMFIIILNITFLINVNIKLIIASEIKTIRVTIADPRNNRNSIKLFIRAFL